MRVKPLGRYIVIAGFFLLVFGLFSAGKTAWATDPGMTSPWPGTKLTSSNAAFNWSAADPVDAYWLGVGTSQDSIEKPPWGDIFAQSTQKNTSQAVSGIPLDGNVVYVRLWWRIGTTWQHIDYTYQSQVPGTAPVEKTGQSTCYDGNGNVIDCTDTGQDGDIQAGVAWPIPRFTDNLDGTITDNLTYLIWDKEASRFGSRGWDTAVSDCNQLADNGGDLTDGSVPGDWHLPNVRELLSIIHFGFSRPAVPDTDGTGHWTTNGDPFNNVVTTWYWTSSSAPRMPLDPYGVKWTVYIGGGEATRARSKDTIKPLWCVRDGQ